MRLIDLPERDPFKDFHRGWSGQGKFAVRAFDPALAIVQRGDEDFFDAERLDPGAGADDIRNGIKGADFVKADVLDGHAVDAAFRHGDAVKDTEGMFLDETGEVARLDQFADLAVIAAFGMSAASV